MRLLIRSVNLATCAGWGKRSLSIAFVLANKRARHCGRVGVGLLECRQPDAEGCANQMALGQGLAANDGVKPSPVARPAYHGAPGWRFW